MRFEGALVLLFGLFTYHALADTHYYNFTIQDTAYTRLCLTKSILTVNGRFPGPTIDARNGDIVIVNVINQAEYNITIHWHGVDQPRNPWSDGPEYITQCPIQPGSNFTYRVDLSEKEGTVWWHAHSDWDRATVHGAIVVRPRLGDSFPFAQPAGEIPLILGEWWKANVSEVIADALRTGADPKISDAYTINGLPGDQYPCSENDTFTAEVETGKTYLLRVVNAAINNELFFAIEGHRLTVVGADAAYTKTFDTDYIMITPGQTFDLLLNANSTAGSRHYIAARAYASADGVDFDTTITTGILQYSNSSSSSSPQPTLPSSLPASNDTNAATSFVAGLRSLASTKHPANVPQTIDRRIVITVAVNLLPCEPGNTCHGPQDDRLSASLNNISFVSPVVDILEAYYRNISGVFGTGFPDEPPLAYNYTADTLPAFLLFPRRATEVKVLEYNTSVEVVFQGTNLLAGENHPMHLHGFSFYVVGRGFGNFDNTTDPSTYNLVDPPFENTVGVPKNGWAAIRFVARNPDPRDALHTPVHGVDQPRNPWSDGPEYITQCPIQPGSNFTYRVDLRDKEGTVWWHAHSDWDRATVHGVIVVRPRLGGSFPFAQPAGEIPLVLGEWWKANVSEVIAEALRTGGSPNVSDAFTINGQPGELYPCSKNDTFNAEVETGKTYLLRVVNAAINSEIFFAIEGHRLTVVGTDAAYTKPFGTDYIMITPGETFDLLLKANSTAGSRHYIAARAYAPAVGVPFVTTITTAILRYSNSSSSSPQPTLPSSLPVSNDTDAATAFVTGLRSLASTEHPIDVPQTIDRRIVITVAVNLLSCETGNTCAGPQGDRFAASLNNISFQTPVIDILDAYYRNISGVFGTGFPNEPPLPYNYTDTTFPGFLLFPRRATEVKVLEHNTNVEVVFQGTNLIAGDNHPMHLHGFSFYVVGRGFGNFNNETDPSTYNLVDPPFENTVGVPKSGWAAIRFRARNPVDE
ncbi:hypothetical protein HPP92_025027 [Vanilla planifolia]|uniref:Laccase n=1 Tax=Vanilla planifolia TaxID=51239 RepID=A0A835PLW4_VANPL|nr:hypothetical protein HPP92_025027 [Vanilla planifolia]